MTTPITLVDSTSTSVVASDPATSQPSWTGGNTRPTQFVVPWLTYDTLDLGDAMTARLTLNVSSATRFDQFSRQVAGPTDYLNAVIESAADQVNGPWHELGVLSLSDRARTFAVDRYLRARVRSNFKAVAFTIAGGTP